VQLGVGVHHQPPGHHQVASQGARGRQARAGWQHALADKLAQALLKLRAPATLAQLDEQLGAETGTRF